MRKPSMTLSSNSSNNKLHKQLLKMLAILCKKSSLSAWTVKRLFAPYNCALKLLSSRAYTACLLCF